MRRTAELAREHGLRLHTHLAETLDEDRYCLEVYGCRPTEFLRRLGWLGEDVWLAHAVHLHPEEVLWMATRGGARCLGRDDVGSLEPDKAADVILIDTRRLSYAGAGSDILAALVFTPFPEPVDTVMVNGRVVVSGGQLVGVDVPRLVERAEAASQALLSGASGNRGH